MPLYGYARVSTRDQDLSAQDAELRAAGCAKVFREKVSGAKTDRPELEDTWADTTTPHGKLMVTVLGGLAEFERTLIAARTGEGRKRAKERSVLFGRPPCSGLPVARPTPTWPEATQACLAPLHPPGRPRLKRGVSVSVTDHCGLDRRPA
jgi:DNA invertase Pin-like site-specific DNA recombinase